MKTKILVIFSLLFAHSISYAAVIEPDLKKPMSYSVVIENSLHQVLYSTYLNNISRIPKLKNTKVSFIDNCIKSNGLVESNNSFANEKFNVFFIEDSNQATSLVVNIEKIIGKKKINTGECYIEEVLIGSAILENELPFIKYEYEFNLKDNFGQELPGVYYLKMNGTVLRNK